MPPPAAPPTEPRPGDIRPELPPFQAPRPSPFTLPPAPIPPEQPGRLAPGLRVFVKQIEITGNKVIPTAELAAIARDYEGRIVTSEELQALRNRLTLAYVNKGYLNSGALLPDQEIKDGVVRYEIVEGALSHVEVTGNQWLRSSYITSRILRGAGPPLNVNDLQERLQILQQDGLIERINAELAPGLRLGEAVLKASVQEAIPYQAGIAFSNRRPPSVGSYLLEAFASHRNLTGNGDTIDARYGVTRGVDDYQVGYALPINAYDTTVSLRATHTGSLVIETPFDAIDIRSKSKTYQVGLTQPLWRKLNESFNLGLRYEKRQSETSLLGVPFSFSPGVPDGVSVVRVVRFSQDWLVRSTEQVIALRSTFSNGRTNADPQVAGIGPDKNFFSWLGQFQLAKRFRKEDQLLARVDVQYSRDVLMALEKIAVGGASTVRGYRENQLLRDNAVIVSVEYRIPAWASQSGTTKLMVAPFVDYGNAWNNDQTPSTPRDIASYGLGLLFEHGRQLQAQIYYAARATHKFQQTTHDLQDSGVHFALSYLFF